MRNGMALQALAKFADVDVLVLPAFARTGVAASCIFKREGVRIFIPEKGCRTDTQFSLISQLSSFQQKLSAFRAYGKPSLSAPLSEELLQHCKETLAGRNYDLIHTARSYCAPTALRLADHLSGGRKIPVTLDLDEDDSRVYRGLAGLARRHGKTDAAQWFQAESDAFSALVRDYAGRFDKAWVSSPVDRRSLASQCGFRPEIVPNTVPQGRYVPRMSHGDRLLFVGGMGYAPNLDAVRWFLREIWPRLSKKIGLQLDIVGSDPPPWLRRQNARPGIHVTGWVSDVKPYYARAALMIAPIRAAAGTRIKLIECAAKSIPIVSTTLGAEGLGLRNGRHLWCANTANRFAAAIAEALARPGERQRRAEAARAHIMRECNRERTIANLTCSLESLL